VRAPGEFVASHAGKTDNNKWTDGTGGPIKGRQRSGLVRPSRHKLRPIAVFMIPANKQEVFNREIRENLGALRDGKLRFVGFSQRIKSVSDNGDSIGFVRRDSLSKRAVVHLRLVNVRHGKEANLNRGHRIRLFIHFH
jgi:hypothetical protein